MQDVFSYHFFYLLQSVCISVKNLLGLTLQEPQFNNVK